MRRTLAALLLSASLLASGSAWPQASWLSAPLKQDGSNASLPYAADNMVLNQAPRRNRMTLSPGYIGAISTGLGANEDTLVLFVPIEANAYAVRIGVANPFNSAETITSASVWPSDSYAGPAAISGGFGAGSTNMPAMPTANSVYQTGTLTNGQNTITGLTTAALPSGATMYVIGPSGMPAGVVTGTVTNGSTVTMSGSFTGTTGSYTIQFANLATECPLFWDNQGADSDTINSSGVNRSITFPANYANPTNTTVPFTLQWSDFAPCVSVPRADGGGTTQILAIYVTLPANTTYSRAGTTLKSYSASVAPGLGNRYIFSGISWANNINFADNPAGTGFKYQGNPVVLAVQYLTDAPGWNIVQDGDSISTAPPDDDFSTPVYRACKTVSTPQAPCEWSSFAWGGTASAIYQEDMRQNIAAVQPSALVAQGLSRNDGLSTAANFGQLWSRYFDYALKYNLRLGFYGAFPMTTSADSSPSAQTAIQTIYNRLAAISKTCQPSTGGATCPKIPVLDPVPYITAQPYGGNIWDYPDITGTANGAAAAGATTINTLSNGAATQTCYPGWQIRDITTPSAIAPGSAVISCNSTSATVANTVVVGGGVANNDVLEFAIPGFSFGSETEGYSADNTHPWYPAVAALMNAGAPTTFVKQLLGLQ